MMETNRLRLPLLAAGQAQKELIHNEALGLIDLAVQSCVESADLATPPATPVAGQCWIVAAGADQAWSGRDDALAAWTDGGWLFATPGAGWRAWVQDRGHMMHFGDAGWADAPARGDGYYVAGQRVVGERQAGIADPAGGSAPDAEARGAISSILAILRAHGLIAS